jgi:diguanylate cyclase (GGDEF) domain
MTTDSRACKENHVVELLRMAGVEGEELQGVAAGGDQAYADALYILTRMHFEPEDAKCFWEEIVRHHKSLDRLLGRDVGLRVAMCDYFTNLHPKMRNPVIVEVQVLLQKEQGALVDELTGLYNRRYFNDAIAREVERYKRFGQRFSLVMLDVDHFKRFNDTYGHTAGDDALKSVADGLKTTARTFDHVVRYGGEEFALILPHTDSEQAFSAAERLRKAICNRPVPVEGKDVYISVSLGTATFPEDAINARELVNRSDEALYEAKHTRNKTCTFVEKSRRFPRAPLSLLVRCEGSTCDGSHIKALNISFGGMLCESEEPILPGTTVMLSLEAGGPGAEPIQLPARVVRLERESGASNYEVALSFDLEGQSERRALVRLVERDQQDT